MVFCVCFLLLTFRKPQSFFVSSKMEISREKSCQEKIRKSDFAPLWKMVKYSCYAPGYRNQLWKLDMNMEYREYCILIMLFLLSFANKANNWLYLVNRAYKFPWGYNNLSTLLGLSFVLHVFLIEAAN